MSFAIHIPVGKNKKSDATGENRKPKDAPVDELINLSSDATDKDQLSQTFSVRKSIEALHAQPQSSAISPNKKLNANTSTQKDTKMKLTFTQNTAKTLAQQKPTEIYL
ncbi:hypothetical protein O0L34_g18621 [Tuta absoluta]|nr:hypothetical protein O0L34_g18621 [Tuta absoluta]